MLALEPVEPLPGTATQVRIRLLGERQEVLRVAPPQLLGLARLLEPLGRVLADRLQHPVARPSDSRFRSRLLSRSDWSVSGSAPATSSAAS